MLSDNFLPQREFSVDLSDLSQTERQVIAKLKEAAELVSALYLQQENRKYPGANFYPHDAKKEEIEDAAIENPLILDPYTIVERNDKGKLVAVPYHVKYHALLLPIAEKLNEAAQLTENKEFAKRLEFQANALLDGAYEASDIFWLSMKPYKIDIVIGPIERYEDKLFFKKCAYQAWVGIMNGAATKDSLQLADHIYTARRKVLATSEKVDYLDKIQVRVDNVVIFSGLIARFMFTSTNLPNDADLVERYGSEITIFMPIMDHVFDTLRLPIFQSIFENEFQKGYPTDILRKASFNNTLLHEISHPLTRYRNAEERLGELFPIFDELLASTFGIKACGSLLLKDAMEQKEFEALMVMFICSAFANWQDYLKDTNIEPYARGYAIAMNYFLAAGAIKESNGISWPNFTKLYVSVEELVTSIERIISIGNYDDAKRFVEKYGSFSIFEHFSVRLPATKEGEYTS